MALLASLSLGGCVSADLGTIAPQTSFAPTSTALPSADPAGAGAEATDVAAIPDPSSAPKSAAAPAAVAAIAEPATARNPDSQAGEAVAKVGARDKLTAGGAGVDKSAAAVLVAALPAYAPAARETSAAVVLAEPQRPMAIDRLIAVYAAKYEVPEALVRRVVKRESNFNPRAYNRGHWGLMQIKHQTARGMGYRGSAEGLLDAETNLDFSVKYLRGAWLVAGGNHDRADRLYQTGYYYHAKRMGLLDETGLGHDRVRKRWRG